MFHKQKKPKRSFPRINKKAFLRAEKMVENRTQK